MGAPAPALAQRRSDERGECHVSISLPSPVARPVLAVGTDLKNTVCWARGNMAELCAHHGSLQEPASLRRFHATVRQILESESALSEHPVICAYDLHPGFASAKVVQTLGLPTVGVQHHFAHGVACAMDAGVKLPVIAIVCDGAGWGSDGAIWGGEVLLCRATEFERVAHLDYFPLPGGDAAARHPWRSALAVSHTAGLSGAAHGLLARHGAISNRDVRVVEQQIDAEINTRPTSSLGRLFDAVSCLLGLSCHNAFEGEAAIKLTMAALDLPKQDQSAMEPYPFEVHRAENGAISLRWKPMLAALMLDVLSGVPVYGCAYRFHQTVAALFAEAATRAARERGLNTVALSGGCFLNSLLTRLVKEHLLSSGMTSVVHDRVSCGDAGLSLGQAVIASAVASAEVGA